MPVNQSLVAAVALVLLPQLQLRGFRVSLAGTATSIIFVATKHVFCLDKSMLVAPNVIFVATKVMFCRGKHIFSRQKTCFVATKMILVAVPVNDVRVDQFWPVGNKVRAKLKSK